MITVDSKENFHDITGNKWPFIDGSNIKESISKNNIFPVFVPSQNSHAKDIIKKGSGIVGISLGSDKELILCYYEGNLYGAENINTHSDKLFHACARMVEQYPTIARGFFSPDELILVGAYNYKDKSFLSLKDNQKQLNSFIENNN